MKKLLLLSLLFFVGFGSKAYSGTCTSDSFTSRSSNTVLTSTVYNSNHSTIYNRLAGNFDGGCVSDGTVEDGALNTTDFAALLNGLKEGCKVTRSDAATLSVDKCIASVNGNFVKTSSANTVTWGCSGCSAEVASTSYYAYAKTGSTGTTLTLEINTGAPNGDGYNADGDKVLARFYNNGSSDIDTYSIDQWVGNDFISQSTGDVAYTPTYENLGTVTNSVAAFSREGKYIVIRGYATLGTVVADDISIALPTGLGIYVDSMAIGDRNRVGDGDKIDTGGDLGGAGFRLSVFSDGATTNKVFVARDSVNDTTYTRTHGNTFSSGDGFAWNFKVPVAGWNE